jgi:hypothetical protein
MLAIRERSLFCVEGGRGANTSGDGPVLVFHGLARVDAG